MYLIVSKEMYFNDVVKQKKPNNTHKQTTPQNIIHTHQLPLKNNKKILKNYNKYQTKSQNNNKRPTKS